MPASTPSHAETWIDLAPALGQGGESKRPSWAQASEASPNRLAEAIRLSAQENPGTPVLALLDERAAAAWRLLPRRERPPLMALVPNVRGMIREATERGMLGAGANRAKRAGLLRLAGLGFKHLPDIPAVLKRDFPTLLRGLCGVEAAEAKGLKASGLILQPQMTDLAVAMGNPRILWDFLRLAESGERSAGFATNNPQALAEILSSAPAPKRQKVHRYTIAMSPRRPAPDPLPEIAGWTWVKLASAPCD